MPELPEVETIVRHLRGGLPGQRVENARVLRPNVVRGAVPRFIRAVEGSTIETVTRRAKFILMQLDRGRFWISHLRMTGQWRLAGPDPTAEPAYLRAEFNLSDGTRMLYIDVRTLGEMEIVSAEEWAAREALLGPEPLDEAFTAADLHRRMSKSRRRLKEFLLDQKQVAGLGNIYVSEALWRAGISPRRRACNVGPARVERLHRAVVEVLSEAIEGSGTSLGSTYLNFADAEGDRGEFYDRLRVYDREGGACARCGATIRRVVLGQRSSYYCPGCQR